MDRVISLSVWCYLHVIRAGNEHKLVNVNAIWLLQVFYPPSTLGAHNFFFSRLKCLNLYSAEVAGGQSSFPALHVITLFSCSIMHFNPSTSLLMILAEMIIYRCADVYTLNAGL